MKVYVDELPERCLDCYLLSDGNFCNHDDFVGELHSVNVYKEKPKNCPLKLLADYTKQVRKEVCEEIKKKADVSFEKCIYENYVTGKNEVIKTTIYSVNEVQLDQIQGEVK